MLLDDPVDAQCWAIVASLGPDLSIVRLALTLEPLRETDLETFCEWFDQSNRALATPAHLDQTSKAYVFAYATNAASASTQPWVGRPADPADLRATIIACGPDAWRAAVANPELLSGNWPTTLGRALRLTISKACRAGAACTLTPKLHEG